MAIQTITNDLAKNPPPIPAGKSRLRIHDDRVRGFSIEIRPTGSSFRFRYFDARHREKTIALGRFGDVTVAQARKRAEQLRSEVALGGDPAASRQTLETIPTLADFLDQRVMPHVRENLRGAVTYNGFSKRLKARLGRKHLDEITSEDIVSFRDHLLGAGLSNATANRHIAFIRMAYNKAAAWGIYQRTNPAASPGMLPERSRERLLTADQMRALREALRQEHDPTAAAAIGLLLLTGARLREVLNAQWDRVDWDRGQLLVPRNKAGRPHRIALSDVAVQLLQEHQARLGSAEGYIFPGRKEGRPLTTVRSAWQRVRAAAGLPDDMVIHELRHNFASILVSEGVQLGEVAALLGHSQLSTTQRYSHFSPDRLKRSASHVADAFGDTDGTPETELIEERTEA